jgi:hypothetical protein
MGHVMVSDVTTETGQKLLLSIYIINQETGRNRAT